MKPPRADHAADDDRPIPGLAALKDVTPPASLLATVMQRIGEAGPVPGLAALKQVTPPTSLVPAVMQRIAEPPPVTFWSWLWRPRRLELRVSPLGGLVFTAAAALAIFAVSMDRSGDRVQLAAQGAGPSAPAAQGGEVVLVRFVLSARGARKVAVVGDFNAWSPQETVLVDSDGQGTFVATVPVRRGLHEYMFLVDGKWMTDPGASETRPDGFGRANAVLRL